MYCLQAVMFYVQGRTRGSEMLASRNKSPFCYGAKGTRCFDRNLLGFWVPQPTVTYALGRRNGVKNSPKQKASWPRSIFKRKLNKGVQHTTIYPSFHTKMGTFACPAALNAMGVGQLSAIPGWPLGSYQWKISINGLLSRTKLSSPNSAEDLSI